MPPLLPSSGGAPLAVACSKRDHHMIANRRLPSIVSKPDRTAQRNSNRCLTSMNSGARWSAAIKTKVIKMASRGVNKVILIGNLGQDPEVRYTPGGKAVANITVATSETWKDQQGQLQERTEWHRCTMYARLAEIAGEYLKKGSKVYLEGRLQTREWQDQHGVKRYTTEIIVGEMQMLDGRPTGGRPPAQANTSAAPSPEANGRTTSEPPPMDFDDDLPFGYIGISGRALLLSM